MRQCAWFADLKREITLNLLRSKTLYSFSTSQPKKVQCMLRRCLSTARTIFSKLVFGPRLPLVPKTLPLPWKDLTLLLAMQCTIKIVFVPCLRSFYRPHVILLGTLSSLLHTLYSFYKIYNSGIFFRENCLKFFNKLYVNLKFYFSFLLSNFLKSVIWSLIFTQGVVSGLLKK